MDRSDDAARHTRSTSRVASGRSHVKRRRGAVRVLVAALVTAALVAGGAGVLVWALDVAEKEPRAPAVVDRAATLAEAEDALSAAAAALERGDRQAWREAVPSAGRDVRDAMRELFRRLSPLPWSGVAVDVRPIDGRPGRFDVYFTGSLGDAGPPDRIMANRVLDLWRTGPEAVVVGDATPKSAGTPVLHGLQPARGREGRALSGRGRPLLAAAGRATRQGVRRGAREAGGARPRPVAHDARRRVRVARPARQGPRRAVPRRARQVLLVGGREDRRRPRGGRATSASSRRRSRAPATGRR